MLAYTYDTPMVLASLAISLMSAFTGLTLTQGISALAPVQRKILVAMAAFSLGGGIWSTHFVAMLAVRLPVVIIYDTLYTMASALIAILLVGTALLIMHFSDRRQRNVVLAGLLMGAGIVSMHYLGMAGIRGCQPVFGWTGRLFAVAVAAGLGIAAIEIAYNHRGKKNILAGTIVFGLSVVIVHFTAMFWTGFTVLPVDTLPAPTLEQGELALIVTLAAFVICGTFLLSAATFLSVDARPPVAAVENEPDSNTVQAGNSPGAAEVDPQTPVVDVRVPYERDRKIRFLQSSEIAAIRAEGRYTILYAADQKHFCPWTITKAESLLPKHNFVRTHRSYLLNLDHVTGFERRKDAGVCFVTDKAIDGVPVSRTRITPIREALGV